MSLRDQAGTLRFEKGKVKLLSRKLLSAEKLLDSKGWPGALELSTSMKERSLTSRVTRTGALTMG